MVGDLIGRIRTSTLGSAGIFGIAYLVGAELGHLLSYRLPDHLFATFWPPAGLFLAKLVLTTNRSAWPLFVLSACIANQISNVSFHGIALDVSLGFCLANSAEACIGAALLRRFVSLPVALTRLRDVLALTALSALLSPMIGATIGAGTLVLAYDSVSFWSAWRTWWLTDSIGVLVIAPMIFTWASEGTTSLLGYRPRKIAERMALFFGLFVVSMAVFGEWLPNPFNVPAFVLPFLLWAAVGFNPSTAASAMLVLALVAVWNTSQGRGPYVALASESNAIMIRSLGTLGVTSLSVLLLAAAVAERRKADHDRRALIDKLRQALAEIKSLRGLIPICAWCKKIRDSQDYWHSVEDYITKHTDAQLSHGMCPECLAKAKEEIKNNAP